MQRLSSMDASFLYMETPAIHMHVSGALILDPSNVDGGVTFDMICRLIESRLPEVPQFRWKLRTVPLNLDNPVWVDDPDFDLSRHLHHAALPKPGTLHQLADFLGRIASQPMERTHPLWRMWFVEGLEGGKAALVSKMHHSGIDGVTGADLIAHLFDFEPTPPPAAGTSDFRPEPVPSGLRVTTDAITRRLRDPLRLTRAVVSTGQGIVNMVSGAIPIGNRQLNPALPFTAPRTAFNGTVTSKRVVAFGQADLEDLKRIKATYGTTVNDVVLAATTITVRDYLASTEGVPEKPLLAAVPVSTHGQDGGEGVNQVSNMFVRLPTNLDDPVDILKNIRGETKDAKEAHNAMGADLIQNLAQITPPGVFNLAARLYSGWGLADRLPIVHNLVISNVPGPPVPLYIAGAKVVGIFPFGPLMEGSGLNITVLSVMGNMDFGVIACGDLVPDPWPIADGFGRAVDELRARADKDSATSSPKRRSSRSPRKKSANTSSTDKTPTADDPGEST